MKNFGLTVVVIHFLILWQDFNSSILVSTTGLSPNSSHLALSAVQIFLREYTEFSDVIFVSENVDSVQFAKFGGDQHIALVDATRFINNERIPQATSTNLLLIVFLCNSKYQSEEVFTKIQQTHPTFRNSVWLILTETNLTLNNSTLISKPWFLTGRVDEVDRSVSLFENYRTAKSEKIISNYKYTIHIGNGNGSTTSDYLRGKDSFAHVLSSEKTRSNFHKLPFRIAAVMDSTYAYDTNITQRPQPQPQQMMMTYDYHDSFAIEILRGLEYTMNFSIELRVTTAWGHLVNNLTWVGMIPLLLSDSADLAISSTADLPFRRTVVDFNMPTNELRLTAFYRQPRTTSQINALIQPFKWDLWLSIFIWLIVGSLTLAYFNKTLRGLHGLQEHGDTSNTFWSSADCFQWALGTLCLQGFYNIPEIFCLRLVVGIGYFSGMLIYAVYAGTLISFLSVNVNPIRGMEQLLSSGFAISVENSDPLPLKFLSESPNQLVKKLYEKRRIEPQYETMGSAAAELAKGSFVFIVNHLNGYESLNHDFAKEDACNIREVIIANGEQKQGSMVNKNSTFKRTIDFHILRMHEYGLIKKWTKKYFVNKPICDSRISHTSVDFSSVALSFAMLALGTMMTIILFMAELATTFTFTWARVQNYFKGKFDSIRGSNANSERQTE